MGNSFLPLLYRLFEMLHWQKILALKLQLLMVYLEGNSDILLSTQLICNCYIEVVKSRLNYSAFYCCAINRNFL